MPIRGVPARETACPVEPRTAATACCLRGSWGPPAPRGGAVGRTGLDGEDPLVGGCGGFLFGPRRGGPGPGTRTGPGVRDNERSARAG
ncbi:hypothetical protein P376_3227 [Streptomyces sp. HCCB10043]|nr:hypothetical protein P376_3227 [Streptomyces sp. HCCB10043]